ncbi:MAG: hypothetical protein JNL70_26100 [Saprospiraceae bacterium]|nr:hypothetical protein [Saprospiraceae bacterium]
MLLAQCDTNIYKLSVGESYTLTAQSGLTNIQWFIDKGSGKQAIPAPNGTSMILIADTEGGYSYTAKDSDNCIVNLCCPINIKVCSPEVRTLCSGGAYELKAPSGLSDIQWFFDNGTGKKAIAPPRGNQHILLADSVGAYTFTAQDTNGCFTELCCPIQLIPNMPIVISSQPNSILECINTNQALSVTVAGDSSTTQYQWQISSDSTHWSNIPNATLKNFTPNSQVVGLTYYRVFIKANDNDCDSLYSKVASVTIVPKPRVAVNTATPSVCKGTRVILNAQVTDGTGTCHVQWQRSTDNGLNWQNIEGATTNTFQTPPMDDSMLFQAVLSCSMSNCCN